MTIPRFTAIATASLALAIGLNILIFSFTSPALFKGLPYPEPDRLLDVSMAPPGRPEARGPLTPALYLLLRDRTSDAFEAVGVFDAGRAANLSGDAAGPAERLNGHRITATGLAALGTQPQLGRLPIAADEADGAPRTMLLSYPVWQRRFGGREDVVGQNVQVDGHPTLILGVMPEGFGLLDNSSDAWFTFSFASAPGQQFQQSLRAVGRLKPGVSIAQAQAAVNLALDEFARTFPNRNKGWTVELMPWREARFGGLRRPLTMVLIGVGVMLLLMSVNLALLFRGRPSVSVLPRTLTLSLAGGAIALVLVSLGLPALRALTPRVLPRLDEVAAGGGVLVFATCLSVLTGLVIGLPAWRASRGDTTNERPASSSSIWRGLSATLIVVLLAAQMTVAFVLLAGAGLAMRAFADLRGRDVGIDPSGLLSFDVHLPRSPYVTPMAAEAGSLELAEYSPAGPALYDRIHAALRTLPGVVQAAGVGTPPFTAMPFVQFWVEEQEHTPDNQVAAQYLAVTDNYFNTMGLRLIRGREFSPADRPDSPWVIVVNATLAREHWPNGDPLGQRLTLTFHPNDGEPPREIIGVVADTLPFRGASEVPPLIYLLHRQQSVQQRASFEGRRTVMSFIARTTGDPIALGDAARELVRKVDVTSPVTSIRTVESYANDGQVKLLQFAAALLSIFAIVALATSVVGVYGFTSYGITQRRQVLTLTLCAVAAVAVGSAAGFVIWRRLDAVIAPFLTNLTVTPSDPAPLVVTGCVLLATALFACLVPALRGRPAGR